MIATMVMRYSALFRISRNIGITFSRFKKRKLISRHESPDFSIDVKKFVDNIKQKGFSPFFQISKRQLDEILFYCNSAKFKDTESGHEYQIDVNNPINPSNTEWYQNFDIYQDCTAVRELAHDNYLVEVAKKYLGVEPTLKSIVAWWSFPPKNSEYTPTYGFHYDIDALKFIKFFIYLVDVDENTGPHVIIENTHKSKSFFEKRNRRLKDGQVEGRYSKDRIHTFVGPAGSGFFEDTFAYHKGMSPLKPRLMLQVEYSI